MVQQINTHASLGIVTKSGVTSDGRIIYSVTGADGKRAGAISVASKDRDTFEKSYNNLLDGAAKLQKYASTHTEEDMKKMKKASRWITGISTCVGGMIFACRKNIKHAVLKTIGGSIAGLAAGIGLSLAFATPPGSLKLAKASKTISKLDVKPYEG